MLGSSSSQRGDAMEDHARQELIEEYFSSSGVGAPEVEGFVWLKADNKKSWKKFFFVLRSSGLYYAPKGKKTSKDLVCLATFDVNQVVVTFQTLNMEFLSLTGDEGSYWPTG